MRIQVELLAFRAFGTPPQIRTVVIPDDEWADADDTKLSEHGQIEERLGMVFHYGQNDFQERDMRSVSVGDVIEYPDINGYYSHYRVDGAGFSRLGSVMYDPKYTPKEVS